MPARALTPCRALLAPMLLAVGACTGPAGDGALPRTAPPATTTPAAVTAGHGASIPAREPEGLPDVHRIELENGLRILLLPRPGAPTVSFVMQYGVGGVHERPGETGVAHLLEHMLFKGTETIGTRNVEAERALFTRMDELHADAVRARERGDTVTAVELRERIAALEDEARQWVEANEFDRILTRAGAQGLNAMTTSEATTYFVELPANRSELFFALESDRMANPVFREFYTERDVVTEERRLRVDASPGGTLYERHLRTAFRTHPYGQPVVGTMDDLLRLGRADVARYYRDYYGPNNAVLAVVGAFDPDAVEGWARRYLEPVPRGLEPPAVGRPEPPQDAERRVVVEWDAEPMLRIGWHVPAADHTDAPAVALLSAILSGGRTSRLYRRLVSGGLAASVYSSTGPGSQYPQLFQIDVVPLGSADPARVEEAIYDEIERLAADGPTSIEMERVRNQIEAGTVRRLQSNLGLAFQLADSESLFGDWRETFRSSEALRAVPAEAVRAVAARYFTEANRTVALLHRTGDR